jgi:hypothetical protein
MASAVAGAPGPAASPMNSWYASLPKPLAAPNNFSWVGATANQMNFLAGKYNSAGNTNTAAEFRKRAETKRKVAKAKYVNAITHKPINNGNGNNKNEYEYPNDDDDELSQPENEENGKK